MFLNLIRSECIKYRYTLLVVTIGLAPLLAAALSIYSEFDNDFHWNHILRTAGLLWFGGWIPMICGLLAGFACQLEKGAGNWKGLLVRPVSPKLVYFSKLFVLVIQMTLSTALLFIILNIASLFFPDQEPVPWLKWGGMWTVQTFLSMSILFLSFWIAAAAGRIIAAGFGFFCVIFSGLLRMISGWGNVEIPFSLMGIQILFAIVGCAAILYFSLVWFDRRWRTCKEGHRSFGLFH